MFNTPILFLVFNRPDTTARVFEQIRKIKPAHLYVAADGPRKDRPGEKELCDEVRKMVLSGVDWECELKTLFQDENLGCGKAPAEGITWFFEQVEEGIILEDDVLPTQSFFLFCKEMLNKFRNDHKIMHISGNNFQLSKIGSECYYLSKLPHSWGWATWRRAWNNFDFEMNDFSDELVVKYFNYPSIDRYWHHIFKITKKELFQHVWDYQWVYTIFKDNGLCVLPQHNLISNIGFGANSTHTGDKEHYFSNLKSHEMDFRIDKISILYDPVADINFHKLFGWETKPAIPLVYTWRVVFKILFLKLNIFKEKY